MAGDPQDIFQVPLSWVGIDELTVVFANQFIIQNHEDGFLLTVGQVAVPPLLGSAEERREQARQLTFVPVRPLGRFSMTEQRVRELIAALEENLASYEKKEKST